MKTFITAIIIIILMLLGFWYYMDKKCTELENANELAIKNAVDNAIDAEVRQNRIPTEGLKLRYWLRQHGYNIVRQNRIPTEGLKRDRRPGYKCYLCEFDKTESRPRD